jgi:glycosyltransferase involved in cell wall biosynthesis
MDLVADQLLCYLQRDYSQQYEAMRICPPMRRRFTRKETSTGHRFNADRLFNRFWDYPRLTRLVRSEFDLFHLVDHSYAQLLHELPPERTIVTCHDLDTFKSLLNPRAEKRGYLFRKMMEQTLSGFQQAALVTCDSAATRDQLLAYRLIPAERTVVVPNGVHPSCSRVPNPIADAQAEELIGPAANDRLDILHVGSVIPRKRIDVLLRVFAKIRNFFPGTRLLRVGGGFTRDQLKIVDELELNESVVVLPRIDADLLAAIYRRAALLLQPSESEGFGLPVVEALACGTPVVASSIPALREVGGEAVRYCEVGNIDEWFEVAVELLREKSNSPEACIERRDRGIVQAERFSWPEYVRRMVALYEKLV